MFYILPTEHLALQTPGLFLVPWEGKSRNFAFEADTVFFYGNVSFFFFIYKSCSYGWGYHTVWYLLVLLADHASLLFSCLNSNYWTSPLLQPSMFVSAIIAVTDCVSSACLSIDATPGPTATVSMCLFPVVSNLTQPRQMADILALLLLKAFLLKESHSFAPLPTSLLKMGNYNKVKIWHNLLQAFYEKYLF